MLMSLRTESTVTFRPLNDWVLVAMDHLPGENTSGGGIILTQPALIRKGTVLAIGKGRTYSDGVYKPCDTKVGERVAFLSAVLESKQGYQISGILAPNEALIREPDILFVFEEGDPRIEK